MPLSSIVYAEDGTVVFKVSDSEGTVGDDIRINITSDSKVDFSTGKFYLHYNNEVLNYKDFELPSSSAIKQEDISVTDDNQGISYIVFSVENVSNADVAFDFSVIAEGNPGISLDVKELFNENEESVRFTVENGNITVKPVETEPVTTTTEPVTTTTEPITTVSESHIVTTTTDVSSSTNHVITTTEPVKTTDSTNTTEDDKPISNSTTTTKPTTTAPANNSTTTKPNNSGSNTTTKPATTTTTNLNDTVITGDNFPAVALTIALSASAAVAFVTKRSKKE